MPIPVARRRMVVAVIGSSAVELPHAQCRLAFRVGQWIAETQYHLLTGGGPGVMAAACQGFCSVPSRAGISVGIIPDGKPATRYPNPWVELPIYTHLEGENPKGADSRNHINVRSSHAIVAFPGQAGTRAELELAIARGASCPIAACVHARETIGGLGVKALRDLGVPVVGCHDAIVQFLHTTLQRTV